MKIRNGFVTNSSSSSFVISFKNKGEVRKALEKEDMYEKLLDYMVGEFFMGDEAYKEELRNYLEIGKLDKDMDDEPVYYEIEDFLRGYVVFKEGNLDENLVNYLTEQFLRTKEVPKWKVRSRLKYHIAENIHRERWGNGNFGKVDLDAPFTKAEEDELQRRLEEAMGKIGDDKFIIEYTEYDDDGFETFLSWNFLPGLSNTRACTIH